MDLGSPELFGGAFDATAQGYGVQMVDTPQREPLQNEMIGRSFRSLRVVIRTTIPEESSEPAQKVRTQAEIARNHAPRAIDGIPLFRAMAGRPDLL